MLQEYLLPIIENYVGCALWFVRSLNGIFYKLKEENFDNAKRENINIFYSIHSQSNQNNIVDNTIVQKLINRCQLSFERYYQSEYEQQSETMKIWKSKSNFLAPLSLKKSIFIIISLNSPEKRLISERGLWFDENTTDKIKWKVNKVTI